MPAVDVDYRLLSLDDIFTISVCDQLADVTSILFFKARSYSTPPAHWNDFQVVQLTVEPDAPSEHCACLVDRCTTVYQVCMQVSYCTCHSDVRCPRCTLGFPSSLLPPRPCRASSRPCSVCPRPCRIRSSASSSCCWHMAVSYRAGIPSPSC